MWLEHSAVLEYGIRNLWSSDKLRHTCGESIRTFEIVIVDQSISHHTHIVRPE